MRTCAIIISHFESLPFLHTCIRQIRKYKHPDIEQLILIADQSSKETCDQIETAYGMEKDIEIIPMKPLYSGYGIDYIMQFGSNLKSRFSTNKNPDFICQLHVDAFPIHKNWLYLPITLIEYKKLYFVGQLQFISKPTDTIYPPGNPFFAMAQCFNVARYETYKEMSLQAGFTRFHQRPNIEVPVLFKNNDWAQWAAEDYDARGSDDDVVAFHWEDKYCQHDKLGLAITGYIEPSYGRIIEDLVFHFGSCREAIGVSDRMPELYQAYTKKINEDYNDALVDEMVTLAKNNRPPELEILSRNFWDGKLKVNKPPYNELTFKLEDLKKC